MDDSDFNVQQKNDWINHWLSNTEHYIYQIGPFFDYRYGAVLNSRSLAVTSDQSISFRLAHVFSPSHFYVHIEDDIESLLIPLMARINHLYRGSLPVAVSRPNWEVGSFWVVKDSRSGTVLWHRVQLLEIDHENSKVTVFLVDFGCIDQFKLSKLRPLDSRLLDTPCLAVGCRLDGIYPTGNKESEDWPQEATDRFFQLTGMYKQIALVSPLVEEGEILSVIILTDGSDDHYSVNELLVLQDLASSDIFDSLEKIENSAWNLWDPMSQAFYSAHNSSEFNPENYDSVTTGYIPRDKERICRFFRDNGSCYKGIKCDQLHCKLEENSTFRNGKMISTHVGLPTICGDLIPNSLVSVQVSRVMSSTRFYAILPHGVMDLRYAFASHDSDNVETLPSLQEALQKEYSNQFKHRTSIMPSIGQIVIVRSPLDDRWYRGRVITDGENDHYVVFFLDFGDTHLIHQRDMCDPTDKFIYCLPAQAVEMHLNGIDILDWEKGRNVFTKLVTGRNLVAKIVYTTPFICVDLYDTTGLKQIHIATELISCKAARPAYRNVNCPSDYNGKYIPG